MDKQNSKKYLAILIVVLGLSAILATVKFVILPKFQNSFPSATLTEDRSTIDVSPTEQADVTLDARAYKPTAMTIISNFEKSESNVWQGGGVIDEKVIYEGARSMGLISVDRKTVVISLEKNLNLSNMQQIEFMLNVSDADAFETAIIDFGDLDFKNYYRYSLSNLKNGWNLIQIPKEKFILTKAKDSVLDWAAITNIRFYTLSRPASIFLARLDMLNSINDLDFLNRWRSLNNKQFLSLYERDGQPMLLARNIGASVATLKDIEDTNDFIFSVGFSPQSAGRSGLFIRGDYNNGYGYYFLIGGDKKNNWQIIKKNKAGWSAKNQIIEGSLPNLSFSRDKKYWLRAETKGDLMEFYLSTDGQKYEKLGEIRDNEFRGGGTGIAVLDSTWTLLDNFHFTQK